MKALVIEDNLIWSSRLAKSLRALGHEPIVRPRLSGDLQGVQIAIVNLGTERDTLSETVETLRAAGVYVVGHAGHKEKQLHELGKLAGCDRLATNSELTYKIEALLTEAAERTAPSS